MLMRFCLPLNSFPIWNVADCQTFDLKEVDKKDVMEQNIAQHIFLQLRILKTNNLTYQLSWDMNLLVFEDTIPFITHVPISMTTGITTCL